MRARVCAMAVLATVAITLPAGATNVVAPNDDIDNATWVTTVPFIDDVVAPLFTPDPGDPSGCGTSADETIWYRMTLAADSDLLLRVQSDGPLYYRHPLSVYTGSPDALTRIACEQDADELRLGAKALTTYYISVHRFPHDADPFTVSIVPTLTISGRITDRDGHPLDEICAFATRRPDFWYAHATSNSEGRYTIRFLLPAIYTVSFSDCRPPYEWEPQSWNGHRFSQEADKIELSTSRENIDAQLFPFEPAISVPPSDWIALKFRAGNDPVSRFFMSYSYSWQGADGIPSARGFAFGDSIHGGTFFVHANGGGNRGFAATGGMANIDVFTAKGRSGSIAGSFAWEGLKPHQTVAALIYGPGLVISDFASRLYHPESGGMTTEVTHGAGSALLLAASPEDGGIAVDVLGTSGGMSAHNASLPSGIAGTALWDHDFCGICLGTWQRPGDNSVHEWRTIGTGGFFINLEVSGEPTFAGPASEWSWTFTGTGGTLGDNAGYLNPVPIYGAYAPVGDDWTLFEPHPDQPA